MTDPRYSDQQPPVLGRDETSGTVWSWVAGLAILALIAFVVVAGWNSDRNTASNDSPATTTQRSVPPPAGTTGSGGSSAPQPMTPAPASRGTQ